jgi:hypothetical protein
VKLFYYLICCEIKHSSIYVCGDFI